MKMFATIEIQLWAAISAAILLMVAVRVFWFLMRTRPNRNRKDGLEIRPLTPTETARFTEAWESLQRRFVTNPEWTVGEAEQLARDIMQKRGYPIGDFEDRPAAVATDHPDIMANYRATQALALREHPDGVALREAVVHYRALFDKLLDVSTPGATDRLFAEERA